MGDFIDRAQFIADQYTEQCISRQLSHGQHTARPDDGPRMCEACGTEIPAARLRALPDAQLCVDCKELEEQRNGRV